MIIGTAGHIDHGKTALVKALTGVDCDRLKEEKARGITLDLGYAYTPLPSGEVLGFIDVPGHEKLIHNMLAGATGIDFSLLVIAADDGPMPQTREHLEIIELLGIDRGVVALTKIDSVSPERIAAARLEVIELLAPTRLSGCPIFAVAATSGAGIAELFTHLAVAAAEAHEANEAASGSGFRLAVDRAFTLAGVGTVVTGTAFAGTVAVGDPLLLSPPGRTTRVRSLHVQGQPAAAGHAGQRIALALVGVDKAEVERGMWLLTPALHQPLCRFDAEVRVLSGQPALKHWTQVHLHLGADDALARITILEVATDADGAGNEIAPGHCGLVQILAAGDLATLAGDRFILRDASARRTIGGGRVLDIFPPSRHKRSRERLLMLHALANPDPAVALALAAETQPAGVNLARYELNRNLDRMAVAALSEQLHLTVVAGCGFAPAPWNELEQRLLAALAEEHQRAPDLPGVERERLRRLTLPALARPVFDAVVGQLLASGAISQRSAWLHLPEHRAQLTGGDRDLWGTLSPILAAAPYNPPRVRQVAAALGLDEDRVRALFKRLARLGEAYPVGHDHYFTATAVADLAHRVAGLAARHGTVRAAALRDEIGGGRKVAIQILEFFDRIGYTKRVRDDHVLRGSPNHFGNQ